MTTPFDTRGYLPYDPVAVPIEALINHVYALSTPRGLGFVHYQEGADVPAAEMEHILKWYEPDRSCALKLDYVCGRAVKFDLKNDGKGGLWWKARWYDHYKDDSVALMIRLGLAANAIQADALYDAALAAEAQKNKDYEDSLIVASVEGVRLLAEAGGVLTPERDYAADSVLTLMNNGLYRKDRVRYYTRDYENHEEVFTLNDEGRLMAQEQGWTMETAA